MSAEPLSRAQQEVVARWFPEGFDVVRDLSWGLVDTVVLHVRVRERDLVLKAAGRANHHISREISGYQRFTAVLADRDLAPRLVHADGTANLLVTSFLPGILAGESPSARDPDAHRQAGAALALFHRQAERVSEDFEARQQARCRELLAGEHRITPDGVAWLAAWLDAYEPGPTTLVPTHGDYSPRNWLVDHTSRLRVIDLGRFDWRPPSSDLCRLHDRHWPGHSDLADAFVDGYGADPRTDGVWTSQLVREAVGTAIWAYRVGDEPFEREGLRMIADLMVDSTRT